jgi:outer membrane protein assembly factor BamB
VRSRRCAITILEHADGMLHAMNAAMLLLLLANWPSFRGAGAAGVADGSSLPASWDVKTGANILWKTSIPGLSHSSPVIWGDRIYVTTAVSSRPDATFKKGLYGAGTASDDTSVQKWMLLSIDRKTGKVVWERVAYEGVPKENRHIKSTYANATPATDGQVIVAFFGSQGAYGFDMNGKPLWSRDLGRFDVGAYDAPEYEWGTASSPILYKELAIFQCDQQKGSFLAALDRKSGKTVWKTERNELPSWGTPTVVPAKTGPELVTNGSNFVRAYDPATGKELWRLGGSSKITAPTPVYSGDLVVIASGRRPEAPVFVVRTGGNGDITGKENVLWHKQQRGSYMPTPLIYGPHLFVLNNSGVLDCYDLSSGADVYRERIAHQGSGFSASPVASDGKIYLAGEDGDIFVVKTGAKYEQIGRVEMGESIMATPAIAGKMLLVRTSGHLFAIGKN